MSSISSESRLIKNIFNNRTEHRMGLKNNVKTGFQLNATESHLVINSSLASQFFVDSVLFIKQFGLFVIAKIVAF